MHVDLFEVKEENKDLEANTQAGCSEAEGGFQSRRRYIRTGLEKSDRNSWMKGAFNFIMQSQSN